MITNEIDYQAPDNVKGVLLLLNADPFNSKILAGGMSLVPMMTLGLVGPQTLISLRNIPELNQVQDSQNHISIGAMTPHYQVASHPLVLEHAPMLAEAASLVGDVQVRNRGTIGGSLVHADPAANYPPTVMALDAVIQIQGLDDKREVAAIDFFEGIMTTAMEDDELVTAVRIPKRQGQWGGCFNKFTRVKGNFPIVCAAAFTDAQGQAARVAIGGATPVPVCTQLPAINGALSEVQDAVESAIRQAIVDPMDDANGSAEYKTEMAVVYGLRAIETALTRAR